MPSPVHACAQQREMPQITSPVPACAVLLLDPRRRPRVGRGGHHRLPILRRPTPPSLRLHLQLRRLLRRHGQQPGRLRMVRRLRPQHAPALRLHLLRPRATTTAGSSSTSSVRTHTAPPWPAPATAHVPYHDTSPRASSSSVIVVDFLFHSSACMHAPMHLRAWSSRHYVKNDF